MFIKFDKISIVFNFIHINILKEFIVLKKKFKEAEFEITQYTINSSITTSEDLGGGDDYNWEF